MGIPLAFSFLFGPAAAWGTAIGNLIYDASTASLGPISVFGFVGNFLIAYLPYTPSEQTHHRKTRPQKHQKSRVVYRFSDTELFNLRGTHSRGVEWMGMAPFLPTAWVIAFTDALWAIVLGSVILASTYTAVINRRLLYKDILSDE